jgi:hypothetical protein
MKGITLMRSDGTGKPLNLPVVLEERFDPSIDITDNPVESGVPVSDHARSKPMLYSCRAVLSESPISADPNQVFGPQNVLNGRNYLAAAERELLDISTLRFGLLRDMMLTSWGHTVDGKLRVILELAFKEVRIAEFGTVNIPKPKAVAKGAGDNVDTGTHGAKDVSSSFLKKAQDTSSEIGQSIAAALGY